MALMDGYDIANKAFLCNPAFDTTSLGWFVNEHTRLKIVRDEVYITHYASNSTADAKARSRAVRKTKGDLLLLQPAVPPRIKAQALSTMLPVQSVESMSMHAMMPMDVQQQQLTQMMMQQQQMTQIWDHGQWMMRQQFLMQQQQRQQMNDLLMMQQYRNPMVIRNGVPGFYALNAVNTMNGHQVMLQEERPFETPSLPQEMTPDDGDTLSPEASKEMDFWLKGSVQKI